MSKTFAVAKREFLQMVLRPVFIIAVLGMPVLFLGFMVLAVYMMVESKQPPLVGVLAVADSTGEVAEAAVAEFGQEQLQRDQAEQVEEVQQRSQERLEGSSSMTDLTDPSQGMSTVLNRGEVRITIERFAFDEPAVTGSLPERVREGEFLAAAVIAPEVIKIPESGDHAVSFALYVGEDLDSDHVALIERRLGQAVVRVRAARENLDPDRAVAMLRRPSADTSRILGTGETAPEGEGQRVLKQMLPMIFMLLLWVSTLVSGQHLLMSTIEEKSNRVMEVLLSAVSPLQLMTGKILGHCGVGLLIALLYGSVVVVGFVVGGSIEPAFARVINPMHVLYLTVFFFIAYFMIASLMAAVGSAVSDIREANTLVTPVMMLMIIPWMLWMPISQAPNGAIATAFSFIPPASPFAMIIRLAAEEPIPFWQTILAIGWGIVCVLGMIWMAAKIFRIGVLMYGKPPTPLELIKWLRYS